MPDPREAVQVLARRLVESGVAHAFGITGSGLTLGLIATLDRLGVKYETVSHEAAGAIMAGAVARLTGKPAVSISIKGPGFTNMLAGIATNSLENAPAVSISEAFGPEAPAHRKHKRVDQPALIAPLTKASTSLTGISEGLPRLLAIAGAEAPGPVHVDLCFREDDRLEVPAVPARDEGRLATIIDRVRRAERPIVVVGSLAMRRPWRGRLAKLRVPVFTTVAAKGVVDERGGWSAGIFTGDGKALAPESQLFERSDLVIGIGLRNNEVLTAKPFGRATVLVDEVDQGLGAGFGAETAHLSAAAADVDLVLEAVGAEWGADEVRSALAGMRGALCDGAWLPAACFSVVDAMSRHTLVLDTGSFCTIGEHLWNAAPDRGFIGSSNGRSMGVGIPTAIGAALCQADRPVVAAVGDGGVRMYAPEMKLAVARRLPLAVVLMTDGRYGSIACVPQPEPVDPRLTQVPGTSWWREMEAMGCEARPVASAAEIEAVLAGWDRSGPLFLEATFEPTAYGAMTNGLR